MYRYSQQMRNSMAGGQLRQQLGKVLMLVLAVAVVVLVILGGRAMSFEQREQSLFGDRMRSEAGQALTLVNSLSRTGGSTTTNMLGKLRQHVYAMESIQAVHTTLRGKNTQIVEEDAFTAIYTVIDTFDSKLQTGQQTKEPLAQLLELLTDLNTKVSESK
jgi:hypothetical protein